MKSCENFVSDKSQYFIYSPSKTARDIFLYPLQCGRFLYEPGYYLRRDSYDNFLLMYVQKGGIHAGTGRDGFPLLRKGTLS